MTDATRRLAARVHAPMAVSWKSLGLTAALEVPRADCRAPRLRAPHATPPAEQGRRAPLLHASPDCARPNAAPPAEHRGA
eukprot:1723646-Prymnesium_polylepis.1